MTRGRGTPWVEWLGQSFSPRLMRVGSGCPTPGRVWLPDPPFPPCPSLLPTTLGGIKRGSLSKSILVPLGGESLLSPLEGGGRLLPLPPLSFSYPDGFFGLCGSGKSLWDFPWGGDRVEVLPVPTY